MNLFNPDITQEYEAQDLLFDLSEFCEHDQNKLNNLANILLEILTTQREPGIFTLKSQDALSTFTIKLQQLGGSINTVSRERAKLEFLSRIGLLKNSDEKRKLAMLIDNLLGQDALPQEIQHKAR